MFLEAVKTPPQNIAGYEREIWMMGRVNDDLHVVDNSTSYSKHKHNWNKRRWESRPCRDSYSESRWHQ